MHSTAYGAPPLFDYWGSPWPDYLPPHCTNSWLHCGKGGTGGCWRAYGWVSFYRDLDWSRVAHNFSKFLMYMMLFSGCLKCVLLINLCDRVGHVDISKSSNLRFSYDQLYIFKDAQMVHYEQVISSIPSKYSRTTLYLALHTLVLSFIFLAHFCQSLVLTQQKTVLVFQHQLLIMIILFHLHAQVLATIHHIFSTTRHVYFM